MKQAEAIKPLNENLDLFRSNIDRIGALMRVGRMPLESSLEKLRKQKQIDEIIDELKELITSAQDILRAIVVFLHATFEDALREIARLRLSDPSVEILEKIPLVGLSPSGQPQKFSLGVLKGYQGKTVEDLIRESVDEHLNKTSFNHPTDVVIMLRKIQIDATGLDKYFGVLDEMMKRRHQIVHQADMDGPPGERDLIPMDPDDVGKWTSNVVAFILDVTLLANPPEVRERVAKLASFTRLKEWI
jgi:hypothetical protein